MSQRVQIQEAFNSVVVAAVVIDAITATPSANDSDIVFVKATVFCCLCCCCCRSFLLMLLLQFLPLFLQLKESVSQYFSAIFRFKQIKLTLCVLYDNEGSQQFLSCPLKVALKEIIRFKKLYGKPLLDWNFKN